MKDEEIDRIADKLAKCSLSLKREWLKSCVGFLEESSGQKLNSKLEELIIDQFLHSELANSMVPLLKIPVGAMKVVISKRMVFQVNSFTNISVSLYEQLAECTRHHDDLSWFHGGQQVQESEENAEREAPHTDKNNNNNSKFWWKKPKKGMYKLEITDGVNTLKAIELEDLFEEKSLVPGVKIVLVGKVKCRRGTLLLDKSNCRLLGGQTDAPKIDKVKVLSEALKIDLDAEKKRKKEALEKASKRTKGKPNKSLNQSTISPFLRKTDRKTGEITQDAVTSHLAATSRQAVVVEEPRPPPPEPTPEPPEHTEFDPIEHNFTWNSQKTPKNNRNRKNNSVQEWAFDLSTSSSINVAKKKEGVKELPSQLLKTDTPPAKPNPPKPPKPPIEPVKIPRKDVLDWKWESKASEELEADKRKEDEELKVMVIPPCFLNQRMSREVPRQKPILNIHGPRFEKDMLPPKPSVSLEKIIKASPNRITQHFPTVKNPPNPTRKSATPEQQEVEDDHFDDEVDDSLIVKRILSKMQKTERIPAPSTPSPISFQEDEQIEGEEERNDSDSILECTIEQEGRLECQRWGLSKEKRESKMGRGDADEERRPKNGFEQSYAVSLLKRPPPIEISRFEEPTPLSRPPILPAPPQSWNQPAPVILPPVKRIKTELVVEEEPKPKTMMVMRQRGEVENEEIRNKQSANVQIYKTPFARRIPSSDQSTSVTVQLFDRISKLNIIPFHDALVNRKYWMMSKIVVIMPTICHQMNELKSDGIDWQFQLRVSDTSASNVTCVVATELLNRIFGFTVQQCKNLFISKQINELQIKKREAERKLASFKRLDLVLWAEVSPESDKPPLIVDVKTLSDALNIL